MNETLHGSILLLISFELPGGTDPYSSKQPTDINHGSESRSSLFLPVLSPVRYYKSDSEKRGGGGPNLMKPLMMRREGHQCVYLSCNFL